MALLAGEGRIGVGELSRFLPISDLSSLLATGIGGGFG